MEKQSEIDNILRQFGATEANLEKAEKAYKEIINHIPKGICFGSDPEHDYWCRIFLDIWSALPMVDGWKPDCHLLELDVIAQCRLDSAEIDEPMCAYDMQEEIQEPLRIIADYHHRVEKKRRQLIRISLSNCISEIDATLNTKMQTKSNQLVDQLSQKKIVEFLKSKFSIIDILLGGSVSRSDLWFSYQSKLCSDTEIDLEDFVKNDWVDMKMWLNKCLYKPYEPIPISTTDIGTLAQIEPKGIVTTELNWKSLTAEQFERLIFLLVSDAPGYENPEWLMKTNASDKGRDLSVLRVNNDALSGSHRYRVIIQCKHWLENSISSTSVSVIRDQMALWEPPKVDVLIIATSGRFSADAVSLIEKHNLGNNSMKISMWPESHIEILLFKRPGLVAEFGLR